MAKKQVHIIRIERGDDEDRILPKGFFNMLVKRFIPVISLVFVASIIGIAGNKQEFLYYLFQNSRAYLMGVFVVLWASGPAIIWIFLQSSTMFYHVANIWYRILAALMVVTVSLGFVLFPEADIYGLRIYFVISIPVFIVIDILFIRNWLPPIAAYPLNALGFCALIYGALINVIY